MGIKAFRPIVACAVLALMIALGGCAGVGVQPAEKYPAKPVELVAAGDPGGGLDLHARMIEQTFNAEKLGDQPFVISNKGGGGGNVCTAYMVTQKGSGYALAINSNRVLLNPLMGTTEYGLKDMTPVARLTSEFIMWAVRSDSKYKTALEVLNDLEKDPKSVVFGVGTIPSNDQFNILLPAKAKGIDFTKIQVVAFKSGGDLLAQLLGGQVPVASTSMSEFMGQIEAGKVRPLVISADKRLDRFPDVPTWKDLGIDVTIFHWRGVFGPPDMPKTALDYWDKKFGEMVKTKTWKDLLAKYELHDTYLPAAEFSKQLEKDEATYRALLGAIGMLKK